jgi:hypothetical protein
MRRHLLHVAPLFVRALTVVMALIFAVTTEPSPAAAASVSTPADAPTYRPPVDGSVSDGFRPPATRFGAGNRGLEYATQPGTPVRASAAGEVVFAGQVGGALHVVLFHSDGLRTSYSFLDSISVRRGDHLEQGDEVGLAGSTVHFGARAGDAYVDPATLFTQTQSRVRLVPDDPSKPLPEASERAGLLRMLQRLGPHALGAGSAAVDWARQHASAAVGTATDELRGWVAYAQTLGSPAAYRVALALAAWQEARGTCTPSGTPTPRLTQRHRVVLVGGLGSASGHAAVLDLDTDALGYAPADVVQYSYRGGSTADTGYDAADTQVPIETSGARLRQLLTSEAAGHPGVPIDVVAHSQGGLVVRVALATPIAGLGAVITIATPHRGADLATLGSMVDNTWPGRRVEQAGHALKPGGIDPTSASVRELSQSSDFIRHLAPVPEGVRLLSIAERLDPVVPAPRADVEGATNVTVHSPLAGNPHSVVPGSDAAEREVARFLAGQQPTCQAVADVVLDALAGDGITKVEAGIGAASTVAGHLADAANPLPDTR